MFAAVGMGDGMFDRFLVWLSAGVVTAGVSIAMVAGAGLALADDGQTSGAGKGTSSESSNSAGKKPDSDKEGSKPEPKNDDKTGKPAGDTDAASGNGATKDQSATGEVPSEAASDGDTPPVKDTIAEKTAKKGSDHEAVEPATHETEVRHTSAAASQPEVKKDVKKDGAKGATDADVPAQTEAARVQAVDAAVPAGQAVVAAKSKQAIATTALAFAAAEPAATPKGPTLINVIGTIFFGLFDMVTKVIAGPPAVPPNSNVRVGRSTLQIDCGDGYTAEADWYVPTSQEPPQGLIYLQHGILARAGYYNVTAAALAESTNSIVVAPTISSNIFACDSCHLTGDPMQFAIAKLFSGDRAALNASLDAAFEGEDIALPEKYVLVGHSGGSSAVGGVAGYASQLGGPNGSPDLAGVILFDTNDIGEFVSRGIAKVPLTTPVYYVAADPSLIDNFDQVSGVMKELRPNQFTGVHLVGGVHTDPVDGTNPLPQFFMRLALGTPKPQNVAAAKLLASGWINDMFSSGPDTGVYPGPGAAMDIETDFGTAHVVGLGGPLHQLSFFESLVSFFYGQIGNLRFGSCAADVDALLAEELATSTDSFAGSATQGLCHRGGEQV
jgi:hypothetical protein